MEFYRLAVMKMWAKILARRLDGRLSLSTVFVVRQET
jgi:hypothetical protein